MGKTKEAYIRLDKSFLQWRWFKNHKTVIVFLWLLASANLEEEQMFSETVPRGSILTNNATIAYECNLTIQNVRTALSNLQKTGEITRTYRNHYQIISVTDFDKYILD